MRETLKITSRSNERLVRMRKARDGKIPGEVFIEGLRLAEEALRSDVGLIEGVFTRAFAETDRGARFIGELERRGIALAEASGDTFKTVADTANSQGIAVIARRPETSLSSFERRLAGGPRLILYFHETNDPSNVGAIFRTAEAAAVSGVILSKGSADPFSPKALRAGMGANLRLPVWERADMEESIGWAREREIRIVAADIKGKASYSEADWTVPSLLIFGSEAHGVEDNVLALADDVVFIPMKNGVESLNLAVSAGIILFEAVRQNS